MGGPGGADTPCAPLVLAWPEDFLCAGRSYDAFTAPFLGGDTFLGGDMASMALVRRLVDGDSLMGFLSDSVFSAAKTCAPSPDLVAGAAARTACGASELARPLMLMLTTGDFGASSVSCTAGFVLLVFFSVDVGTDAGASSPSNLDMPSEKPVLPGGIGTYGRRGLLLKRCERDLNNLA